MIYANCIDSPIIVNKFKSREIKCAFHDIDGTHSLIREWPPVMSIVLWNVIENGLPEDFDTEENALKIIAITGKRPLPETDAFCIESAGLSALTQMEWAIRRAIENGSIAINCDKATNSEIARKIYKGEELFGDITEAPELSKYLSEYTPRLFRFYERVLNGYCRDGNLERAKTEPEKFIIPGSPEFLEFLRDGGVRNYFVTGAVVQRGMGMFEEVETLGYKIGSGETVEDIVGSTWTDKVPKNIIMKRLMRDLGIDGENILVVGDGRSEISAGAEMGAVTLSRLSSGASHQKQIHLSLGTDMIVEDYLQSDLYKIFTKR